MSGRRPVERRAPGGRKPAGDARGRMPGRRPSGGRVPPVSPGRLFAAIFLALFVVLVGRELAPENAAGPVSGETFRAAGTDTGALSDTGAAVPSALPGGAEAQEMEVHFLDVGQADCTLLFCGGQTMVIDAGNNDDGTAIQLYLTKQGVERIDWLILTHPDSDHIGGADVLITKFDIGTVYMSDFQKDNRTYEDVVNALEYKRLKWSTPEVGSSFPFGTALVTVLGPVKSYDEPNNASVALLVQNGEDSFLFTGDAESEAEEDILEAAPYLAADVFQAGHHGSSTSNGEAFLDAVAPETVVISCGKDNSYGHPHEEVLERLEERDIDILRTDELGTIIAESSGEGIVWRSLSGPL